MDSSPPRSAGAELAGVLLDASGELAVALDHSGTLTYVSERAAPSFLTGGRARDEVVGRVLWDAVPDMRGSRLHAEWSRVATSRQPASFEYYSAVVDRWFVVRLRPAGDVIAILARDVTEERHARVSLQARELRLREALVAGRIGAWEWDIVRDVVIWNATQGSLRGPHVGEMHQSYREFLDRVYAPDRARVDDAVRRAMLSHSTYAAESRSIDARGTVRHYASRGEFVYDDAGRPVRMYGVTFDITAGMQREAEQRVLADVARKLGDLTDFDATLANLAELMVPRHADSAILFLLDAQGAARKVAAAHADPLRVPFLDQLGAIYQTDMETPGTAAAAAIASGYPAILPELSARALAASTTDTAAGERLVTAYQVLEPASTLLLPLTARGRTVGALVLGMSAASRRRFAADDVSSFAEVADRAGIALDTATRYLALHAVGQSTSHFLSVLAHELRTPLNSVIGYAHLLEDDLFGPLTALQSDRVRRLRLAGEHMLHLVQQILQFAGLESGRTEVSMERVRVDALVQEAASFVEPLARQKGLELDVQTHAGREIETDPVKVRQILVNLLANAINFTERGTVAVRADVAGDAALFQVQDTGIGIAAPQLAQVFEAFWRAPAPQSAAVPGTGLGLAVARELSRLLGGDLTAASVEGQGSTFTLWLPLVRPKSDPATARVDSAVSS